MSWLLAMDSRLKRIKKEKVRAEERLEDVECKKCSFSREPISLEEIMSNTPDLFLFEQDGTCFCYFVYNLYKHVFGTETLTAKKPLRRTNPLTNDLMGDNTIERLRRAYKKYHQKQGRGGVAVVDGIALTEKDVEDFRAGVALMIDAVASEHARPTFRAALYDYTEDIVDLADEDSDEARKAKALYKHFTKRDFE